MRAVLSWSRAVVSRSTRLPTVFSCVVRSEGFLRLEHRPQPDQLRVGLLHALGGHLGEQPLLDLDPLAARTQVVAGLAQCHLGLHQLVLHLLVQRLGGGQLAPGDGQRRAGLVQLGPGRVQCAVSLGRGPRGVLQVCLGRLQTLLDLVLLVLEVVRVGVGRGGRCRGHGERDRGRQEALPRGGGEVANHEGLPSFRGGSLNEATVTRQGQTLRYLRVSTSVGIIVSTTPSKAIQPTACTASHQSIQSTIVELGRSLS